MAAKLKMRLYCSTAAVVLACVGSAQAQTQNQGQEQTMETVVVTGQRAAIENAIIIKEKAEEIVDVVSAEDVGKLPDNSITEVLQRVAGVNMTRLQTGTGSEDYLGEGTGITIRGLDSVVSQLNGRDSFSSANGRNLSWEDVPPELAQGVDVYKSLSAWLPEGGFGGVINLRTRQPFDFEGLTVNATLTGNYADYAAKGHFGGVGLISDRWHTKIGEMGLLLNVAYSDLETKADGVQVQPYIPMVWSPNFPVVEGLPTVSSYNLSSDSLSPTTCTKDVLFKCQEVYAPLGVNFTQRNDRRVRSGYYAAFQWNPSERLTLFATAFRSRYNDNTLYRTLGASAGNAVALDPASTNTFDSHGNLIKSNDGMAQYSYYDPGVANVFGVNANTGYQKVPFDFGANLSHQVNQTTDFSAGGEWDITDRWALKFALQHVESFARNKGNWADLFAFIPGYGLTLSSYGSSTVPQLVFPSNLDLTNKYRYGWNDTMDHLQSNGGQENALYADAIWTISDTGFFRVAKFGIKVTDRTENDWETPYNWQPLTPTFSTAYVQVDSSGNTLYDTSGHPLECFTPSNTCYSKNTASVNASKTAANTSSSYTELVTTNTWFNGAAGLPAQAYFPALSLLKSNYTTVHSYANGLGAPGDQQTAVAFRPGDQSKINERLFAGYAQVNFAYENWRMPITGTVGVRIVAYRDHAIGSFINPYFSSPITLMAPTGYPNCVTPADWANNGCLTHGGNPANVLTFTVPRTYVTTAGGHSEVDALPSLNIQILPMPERLPGLKVRLAASQGLSRPSFSQLNPKGSGSGSYVGSYQSYFNGSMGNPNLKPEKAEQFDASIEYYFPNGGLVHFSPFYKQIHNYIASAPTTVNLTLNSYVAGGTTGQGTMGCATPVYVGEYCPQIVSTAIVNQINEKKTATVRGFEVGLTKYANFLPDPFDGFGVDLNYTYISSSQPGAFAYDMKGNPINNLPALGLSKNTYNATLMYDKKPISVRLAYNYRDDFLITTAAWQTTNQYDYSRVNGGALQVVHYSLPVYQYPMGTLDANLALTLTDNVEWTFQASNLTKAVARVYMGVGDHRVNRSWYTADTRYTSQLRVKF